MYFFAISAPNSFILLLSTFCAALTASALPCSYASIRFVYASAGNFESTGSSTYPSSAGSFMANSTLSPLASLTFAFTSYCSGAIISPNIAPSCISPSMPLVFTFESTFERSPTPAASVCISPRPLYTCSSLSLTSAKERLSLSSSVFCSFSSTTWRISSSFLPLSSLMPVSCRSTPERICSMRCAFSSAKVLKRCSWFTVSLWYSFKSVSPTVAMLLRVDSLISALKALCSSAISRLSLSSSREALRLSLKSSISITVFMSESIIAAISRASVIRHPPVSAYLCVFKA